LDDDEQMQFESALQEKKYHPNEIILEGHKTCKSILFLASGLARSFFINDEGQEYTWSFHFNDKDSNFKNLFIFDYNSFLQQTPSPLTIQAITHVEAIELHYEKLQHLLRQSDKIQMLVRIVTEQAYQATHARAFSLLTQSAKERYLKLVKEEPYLLTKFPHYFIASYLGIAPQSLSRLRKEIIKN
jgi:CRP-like cAMP-binding protein